MDSILSGIIIGVLGSLIATGIAHLINAQRKRSIKGQIEELKYEEEFLDRISRGNIQLLRSSFITLFMSLGLLSISIAIFIICNTFEPNKKFKFIINVFCATISLGVSSGLISQAKSIRKLRNLPEERKKIQSKIGRLEKKI